jgi:triphosphoribosyl-dephospho-CoA synthetase
MLISLLWLGAVHGSGDKSTELKQKMSEINSLQQSLTGKIALAVGKKDQLEQKKQELGNEVRDQKKQFKIDSYQNAIVNARIDNNLKLIQLLLGYIARLNDKIVYFKAGQDTLNFFSQQVQDDLLMIKTLNDLETDKLIAQLDEVLDEYISQTNKPMFDVNDVPLQNTEQIWNEIIKSN